MHLSPCQPASYYRGVLIGTCPSIHCKLEQSLSPIILPLLARRHYHQEGCHGDNKGRACNPLPAIFPPASLRPGTIYFRALLQVFEAGRGLLGERGMFAGYELFVFLGYPQEKFTSYGWGPAFVEGFHLWHPSVFTFVSHDHVYLQTPTSCECGRGIFGLKASGIIAPPPFLPPPPFFSFH